MKIHLLVLCVIIFATVSFGQTDSKQPLADSLVGDWISTTSENVNKISIKKTDNILLITEESTEIKNPNQKPYITESKIYLDGRVQKDGLKQSATEAKTEFKNSKLITTFFILKDGKLKESFKERLSIKDGNLVREAQVKLGVPFLAAGTKEVFRKVTNILKTGEVK
jgi:hypothetical protein